MGDLPAILHAFADLSPEGTRPITYDVTRTKGLAWLGTRWSSFVDQLNDNPPALEVFDSVRELAAHDALQPHQQTLREGWVFLTGRVDIDGSRREVCLPLLSAPVRLSGLSLPNRVGDLRVRPDNPRGYWSARLGDRELTPLVRDDEVRSRLEEAAEFGGGGFAGVDVTDSWIERFPRLRAWIHHVATAAGFEITEILKPTDPRRLRRRDGLCAVVGSGIYAVDHDDEPDRRRTLRDWADRRGIEDTALATVYAGTAPAAPPDEEVASPLPLNPAQRELVVRARHEQLVVASGAPGTGKSHAVVATAVDALVRGESVLVATQSPYAANVLADLLDRHPGPTPLVFGNGERRTELLDELTDRLGQPLRDDELRALDRAVERTAADVESARYPIRRLLELEAAGTDVARWEPVIPALLADVPRVFDADHDLDATSRLLDELAADRAGGWWSRRRRRRDERRLAERTGARSSVPLTVVADAIRAARARRDAAALAVGEGTELGPLWPRLTEATLAHRGALGARAAAHDRPPATWTGSNRRAVAALLAALRAGRAQRRRMLADLDAEKVTRSVPLWVGNLRDIEDLIPQIPGLFDLVILDEASQIDQPAAALALLRGRRAVVVGDPRQLRHVSFLSDADVETTIVDKGIGHLADRLDLRRVSAFDAAAASSPVTWLDEHHRSIPHLISFSSERFYRGRVLLATRHPAVDRIDAIDVVAAGGVRGDGGVNRAEVELALDLAEDMGTQGWASVGIVTPFRAQADALEEAALARFDLDAITSLGLQIGTVHAFQGSERDVLIISLGLDPDTLGRSRRFVEDPNLFNVMITRGRERVHVLSSLADDDVGGLLGDYIAWASAPPPPPDAGSPTSTWSAELGAELARNGVAVTHGYEVGRWTLDLVAGDGRHAAFLECQVHPDGAEAHIERHLALDATGWRIVDAYPSRWDHDAAAAAIELAATLQ